MPRKILVLNGHPAPQSLSRHLAETYAEAARGAGHDVRLRHVADMDFDPDFDTGGYADSKPLEPDLEAFVQDLEWCGHFTLCSPMWWGTVPARTKGLFDRAFIPGRTFDPRNPTALGLPGPMLGGRTARVVVTSDSPGVYLRLAHGNAMLRQLKGQVLGFVGFKPVRVTYCAPASDAKPAQLERWRGALRKAGVRGE